MKKSKKLKPIGRKKVKQMPMDGDLGRAAMRARKKMGCK
jgi:hypothetical protein